MQSLAPDSSGASALARREGSLPEEDVLAILAGAKAMHRAAGGGAPGRSLRGRHIGLLCDQPAGDAIELLRLSVAELGGRLAHVRSQLPASNTTEELGKLAQVLGRLYDAIECQGLDAWQVQHLARNAGVPVFDGIATASHPTARLVARLDCEAAEADKRRLVLKAALLHALG
jgi:ornithine carbamoyltransferase